MLRSLMLERPASRHRRNYRPDLGKWQTQDPIGLANAMRPQSSAFSTGSNYAFSPSNSFSAKLGYRDGWNSFAYCNNRMLDHVDRLGFYEIEWEGTWTQSEKDRVVNSFVAVSDRMNAINNQIADQIAKITSSGRSDTAALLANLTTLKEHLQQTIENINSTSYNLEIYKSDLGDSLASYWSSTVPWYDDELNLDNNFFNSSDIDYSTIFHELTHTWSDDGESNNDYLNAHMLESLYDVDLIRWPKYLNDYLAIYGVRPE